MSGPVMPEGVARILAASSEEPLLVMERDNQIIGVGFMIFLGVLSMPMVVLGIALGSWWSALAAFTFFGGLLWLFWLGVSQQPTDVVLTRRGVHRFWRLASRTRHHVQSIDAITSVEANSYEVTLHCKDGKPITIPLTVLNKGGVFALFVVTRNATGRAFDTERRAPNHVEAFGALLEERLRER